jgi:hypothetical protein
MFAAKSREHKPRGEISGSHALMMEAESIS